MSEENKVIAANEPERAEGSNFIDNLSNALRTAFMPGPSRRTDVRNYRNAFCFCKFCQTHIKPRIINNHQTVRFSFFNYFGKSFFQFKQRW